MNPPETGDGSPTRRRFRREDRVRHRTDFEAVYAARASKRFGPIQVHARFNGLEHARVGLAVPRRVGPAPRRNRVRRRIREAFRLIGHELPPLDLVVHVRAHDPLLGLEEFQRILRQAAAKLAQRLEDAA